jgi:replicative DNA helicase
VIGAVLINPDVFHECRIHLGSGEEFYIHRLRWIWQAYESMFSRKVPVDLLTLANELEAAGRLKEIGGPAYLTSLINQVPSSLNAASYAAIVHGFFIRRRMISAANKVAEIAYDQSIALDDGISQATHELSSAVAVQNNPRTHNIEDSLRRVDAKIEERGKLSILPGIPTGLIDLDRLLGGGAQDSDLLVIAGRPGKGKTALLLQLLLNAAYYKISDRVYKKRVVIFSLEMPEEQLVLRLIAQLSGINSQDLRSGKIPEIKIAHYIHALDYLSSLDIVIDDTPGVSPAYIRSRCEILNAERKLDAVFVDSLNLMRSGMNFKAPHIEVDYDATELKNLARELNIPVWAAHQMSRNVEYRGENSKPKLSDLRDGGEQPADVVMFIHHEKDENDQPTSSSLIVDKHRNGPTDEIAVVFRGEQTKFESAFKPRSGD